MVRRLRHLARKSKIFIIAYRILDNWRTAKQLQSSKIKSELGATHQHKTLEESVEYIRNVFDDYLKYSGLPRSALMGKRILEIGHGDNFGVALMFIAAGVQQVVCLDRFNSELDVERQEEIYRALRLLLEKEEKERFDAAVNLEAGVEFDSRMIECVYGTGIEDAAELLDPESFELIVSRAVLEYTPDSDAAFSAMRDLLAPGGYMVHKIDLRDDGMFSSGGMHPLTFLTIRESVYRLMTADSGRCNRKLINYYRQKMREFGFEQTILVTGLLGVGELIPHKQEVKPLINHSLFNLIEKIRPKLAPSYRGLSTHDLLVSGIFLTARKPLESVTSS